MPGIVEVLNRWGSPWATLMLAMVWQSTLVALLVALAAYALVRRSPTVRYWLWQIVAIKLLVIPLWSVPLALPWLATAEPASNVTALELSPATDFDRSPPGPLANAALQTTTPRTRPSPFGALAELSWQGWLLAGWGAIVLAQIVRLGVQWLRLAQLLRQTTPGDERLRSAVERVSARLQVRRPRVVTTQRECSPFVCGIVRPTLVLSRELAASLATAELEPVLAHELAHIKRGDLIWGWIPQIARMLYFFHPIAQLACYRIRLERELACDQIAMHLSGRTAGEYAETLVRVLSAASRPDIFRTSAAASLDGGASLGGREETP